jgi:hypothetical protein
VEEKKENGEVRVYKRLARVSGPLYVRAWTLTRTEVRENEMTYRRSEHNIACRNARYEP